MYLTGMLDDRTLEKYEQEAKSKGRESWKFAWALDVTDQERAKGKTEECGRAYFKYGKKRVRVPARPGLLVLQCARCEVGSEKRVSFTVH